jgi:DNA helicase-2/ATP-dependent DNA helicase PcrA
MFYIADLHTHSHYADATSKFLCLETMYQWALIKGIDVVSTGDFTHPAWLKELEEKLQPQDNGFFTLKDLPEIKVLDNAKPQGRTIYFCLSTEVSCEYTIKGVLYKNHHLIYAKNFETAHHISNALSKYGNLALDGRPTLNLSAHQLLQISLGFLPKAHFVPAHVWTPWFSALGSKNGHASMEDCFKDITQELFAVETSLSADPQMCRRYSGLDRFTLLSNSDAHSAHKLGREVNLLDAELSYDGMFEAIKNKNGFLGTYEYYPQRGKYYNDGHRDCNITINPEMEHDGICPVCNKPLTIGVGRRVEQLADRSEEEAKALIQPFKYVLPLPEIIAEIIGVKEDSKDKNVGKIYASAISCFGNEFDILQKISLTDIERHDRRLAISIARLREDKKQFTAGYDGVHGHIRFLEKKKKPQSKQMDLF